MKRMILTFLFGFFVVTGAEAQTLGETLKLIEERCNVVVSRQQGETWGVKTAVDDLQRLKAQSQRLAASLSSPDARDVKELEDGLRSATRAVRTSKVMLPENEHTEVEAALVDAGLVADRLTDIRLRFGSKANIVSGPLADLSVEPGDSDLPYENIQQLLVDVRWTRELMESLMPAGFPQPGGIGFGMPNNLDPLEVQRATLALWNLERTLSTNLDDVRESIPAWENFKQEYDRLNYMGPGRNVRQLERAVKRMDDFYSNSKL